MRRLLAVLILSVGCSNSHSDSDSNRDMAPAVDAAIVPDLLGGEVSATYPAFSPEMPQVTNMGGPVLATPRLIAVTFPDETLTKEIEDFATKLGPSSYFAAVTSEYGISAAVAGTPIHLTETAPTSIDDSAIATWIQGKFQSGTPAWGVPDPGAIYMLFYPATTTITMGGGTSCQDFGGYHIETQLTDGTTLVYAVIPRCAPYGVTALTTDIQMLTAAASHEIVEASEDPQPDLNPAWATIDDDHAAWAFNGGAEAGDLCALDVSNFYVADFGYTVQRTWSNNAAMAHHDPCVPAPTKDVFFASVPVTTDDVDLGQIFSSDDTVTKGYAIAQGASATIEIDLLSDAPTTGPWTVKATDGSLAFGNHSKSNLMFSFDKTTGQNGEKLHLTVTVLGASKYGFEIFTITSTLAGKSYDWTNVIQVM